MNIEPFCLQVEMSLHLVYTVLPMRPDGVFTLEECSWPPLVLSRTQIEKKKLPSHQAAIIQPKQKELLLVGVGVGGRSRCNYCQCMHVVQILL